MCIANPSNFWELSFETIRSETQKGTFNDYSERKYMQAHGNGGVPKGM